MSLYDGRFEMPILGRELVQAVEECFDADGCEVGNDCLNPAIWWAHNPCGCRLRSCAACKINVLRLSTLVRLHPTNAPALGCGQCLVPLVVDAITWEAIRS